jgi:hypothetical protein
MTAYNYSGPGGNHNTMTLHICTPWKFPHQNAEVTATW